MTQALLSQKKDENKECVATGCGAAAVPASLRKEGLKWQGDREEGASSKDTQATEPLGLATGPGPEGRGKAVSHQWMMT